MNEVSIITPLYNQWAYTVQFLDSLGRNTDRSIYELIIIDNASTDETTRGLHRYRHLVDRVLRNEKNLGVSKSWNQGLLASTAGVLCFVNNDVVVFPGWLDELLAVLDADDVWCASPRETGVGDIETAPTAFARTYAEQFVELALQGFCFALKRSALLELYELELAAGSAHPNEQGIALFDEQFDMACFEDWDMNRRLESAGHRPVIALRSFVHHFGMRTRGPMSDQLNAFASANRGKYQVKYGDCRQSHY